MNRFSKKELMEKYKEEMVYCVPYEVLKGLPDGYSNQEYNILSNLEKHGKFIKRYDAEYNPTFQQLIPYVIIYSSTTNKIFAARRIGGEQRLLGKWSFFGGHINPCDIIKGDIIKRAAVRELHEELKINKRVGATFDFHGTIKDIHSQTNDHVGFLFSINVRSASVIEHWNMKGKWFTPKELIEEYSGFENWGKYAIDQLFEKNIDVIKF